MENVIWENKNEKNLKWIDLIETPGKMSLHTDVQTGK